MAPKRFQSDAWKKAFNLKTIKIEQKYTSKFIKTMFKEEIYILEKMIGLHIKLSGYFFKHAKIKKLLRLEYDENIVMDKVLFDQIYLGLSILEILKKGYYGSARVLLRQMFEMLMIAKCSEFDKEVREKFVKEEAQMKDVWEFLKKNQKKDALKELKEKYKELCKYTHATPASQQPLRLPSSYDKKLVEAEFGKWIDKTNFTLEMRYTLDLFFVLLNMLFHFDNLYHRKVRRFDMGYYKDRFGDYKKIKKIKSNFMELKKQYLLRLRGIMREEGIKELKRIIYHYRSSWGIKKLRGDN